MKGFRISIAGLLAALCFSGCTSPSPQQLPTRQNFPEPEKDLYGVFKTPQPQHRPFVRWWWNGLRVDEKEILRELDLMKAAGIGGVEINSIAFPGDADPVGYREMPYLSDDWVRMIRTAADGCRERGMWCDIIGGSGWPFGGEFIPRGQQLQMLTVETIDLKGGEKFSMERAEILRKSSPPIMSSTSDPEKELVSLRLMPAKVDSFTDGEYLDGLAGNDVISFDVPGGDHVLYCFIKHTGYMGVILGAAGAKGPVLNHLDSTAVNAYLKPLSDKLQFTSPEMKGKIRAVFVDSFELEGANWSSGFPAEFEKRAGYSIIPYLPYVIRKVGHMGTPVKEKYGSEISPEVTKEVVERVRNDFERVQIELFNENFIQTFNNWCHRNGLKSRIQAYGRQLHPLESAMYIDIPECETWLWDRLGEVMDDNNWFSGRAYSMVNKFVSSGSLLSGNGRVSCEEITNVDYIFRTTLEEIKIAGDLSNLSGVNHSILHGFNYSPPEAGFPGWVRYGTYFSAQNTWWPYLHYWLDYKARISAVLQNSVPQADIAILPPLEDMWSVQGQMRDPFPEETYPFYAHDLWENLHQNGNGCDYISDNVIAQASVKKGVLTFGPRSYKTLMLMEVESLSPAAARIVKKFVETGGKVVCIGQVAYKSFGLHDAVARDASVKSVMDRLAKRYPERFIRIASPVPPMTEWYTGVQRELGLTPYVKIDKPTKWLSQNYYKSGDRDIFFFVHHNLTENHDVKVEFPASVKGKQAWLWDPETGERWMLTCEDNAMDLHFAPVESKMIVFDTDKEGEMYRPMKERPAGTTPVAGTWKVKAVHVDGSVQELDMESLEDFNSMPLPWFRNFAGTIEYTQKIEVDNPAAYTVLDIGHTRYGVTELLVNGESAGVKWYGERMFDISGRLHSGSNEITVKVTTLLNNYTLSLTDNIPAQRSKHRRVFRPMGLEGPVEMY